MAKKNKAEAQNRHAKRRAMERYEIDLNRHKRLEIVHMIQTGKAQLVRKQSHRVTIFSLQYEGKEVVVVYDGQRKTLATFLPIEAKFEDTFMGNIGWRDEDVEI